MDARRLYPCIKDDGTPDYSIFSVLEHVSKSYGNPLFSIVKMVYDDGQMIIDTQNESYDASSLENAILAKTIADNFPIKSTEQYMYDSHGNIYMTNDYGLHASMVLYRNPGTGLKHDPYFHR